MFPQSESRTIIIDNGSRTCKVGFSGDELPNHIIKTMIGSDPKTSEVYVSNDAYLKGDHLDIKYPIERRMITNWEEMEQIWTYIFHNQLLVESSSHPVLLTDDPQNSKENREKMVQIMFETFNVPSLYIAKRPVLSLYSSGRLNGIILDSGDSTSLSTPIYGGYCIPNAFVPLNIAGHDITLMLQKLLNERGYNLNSFSQLEVIREIKEKHCYLSTDFETEIKKEEVLLNYTLPNGNVIKIGNELFRSSELLFKPQLNGFNTKGIVDILFESIDKCNQKIRHELYSNIVICGGTTKLRQFKERIENEIKIRSPSDVNVNIIQLHRRQYSSWIGGSTLASLPTFNQMMITNKEYQESGTGIARKFP